LTFQAERKNAATLLTMSTVADKVLNALDAALAKPKATLYQFLTEQAPEAAISKDEIHALRDGERKWKQGFEATCTFTEGGARVRYYAQFGNGQDHTDAAVRTRGLDSFISENEAKMKASKEKMETASKEAAKVVNGIRARLLPIAEQVLSERQKAETTEAERFGLVPVLSALTTALAQFTNGLKAQSEGSTGNPPRQMCVGLLDLN
jgi:hypothetical protein